MTGWAKAGLYGAGALAVGAAAGTFFASKASQDRNFQPAQVGRAMSQPHVMAMLGGAAAAGIGLAAFHKPLLRSLGHMMGASAGSAHPLIDGLIYTTLGTASQIGQSVKSIERDVFRRLILGNSSVSKSFGEAWFPNINGVNPAKMSSRVSSRVEKEAMRATRKEIRKSNGPWTPDHWHARMDHHRAETIQTLNNDILFRLQLNHRVGNVLTAGGIAAGAFGVYRGATSNLAPPPSTYYDGVSMRHRNDMGMDQSYADAIRGSDLNSFKANLIHMI